MSLSQGLADLVAVALVAAITPIVVAILPGPRIPQVVVFLFGGILIGPHVLGLANMAAIQLLVNIGLGFLFLATFALAFWYCAQRTLLLPKRRWFLRWVVWAIPLPWIAAEFGWVVAETGRQPWTIAGVLPTSLAVSSLSPGDVALSLSGFVLFYTLLFIVEITLMFKYARLGPSSLHTGRYHGEQGQPPLLGSGNAA